MRPGILDQAHASAGPVRAAALARLIVTAIRIVWRSGRMEFCWVVACALLLGIGAGVQVLLVGRIVGAVLSASATGAAVTTLLPGVLGLVILTAALGFVSAVARERERLVGELVAKFAQAQVLQVAAGVRLEEFERPEFYDRLQRATVTAVIRPAQLASGLLSSLSAFTACFGVAAGLLVINPLLGVLASLSAVPLWLAASHANRALYRFSHDMTHDDRARAYVADLMTGKESAAEVRAFGLLEHLEGRFHALFDGRITAIRHVVRSRLRAALAGAAASTVVVVGVVVLAGALATNGRLSLADAGAAVVAIALLGQRLAVASDGVLQLHESTLFVEDLTSFVEPELARLQAEPRPAPPAGFDRIELRNVRFRYPQACRDALNGIDLDIRAGEVIAFVGENGSGKTTLAKLVAGLYRPSAGSVLWDGRELSDAERAAAGEHIAVAFQDFVRYRFTVAENVMVGRPERWGDIAAVTTALRRAGADPLRMQLPDGLDTQLGTQFLGGLDLSGGQWQRLAIARTFFRDASLLILDEPTAALDPRAERALFDDIRSLCHGRTVLLVSHRFANVRSADRIHVLVDGHIHESGSHDDLMAIGGRYAELFTLQAANYLDAPTGDAWRPSSVP